MSALHSRAVLTAALLFGALLPAHASAQCNVQGNTSIAVNPALISFTTPTIADYDNGAIVYQSTVSIAINGRGGSPWSLCVQSLTPDLGTVGGVTKPVTDVQWQAPGGAWIPLSAMPQVVASARGDVTFYVNVRILLDWAVDGPGVFGTTVQFTVAR